MPPSRPETTFLPSPQDIERILDAPIDHLGGTWFLGAPGLPLAIGGATN